MRAAGACGRYPCARTEIGGCLDLHGVQGFRRKVLDLGDFALQADALELKDEDLAHREHVLVDPVPDVRAELLGIERRLQLEAAHERVDLEQRTEGACP